MELRRVARFVWVLAAVLVVGCASGGGGGGGGSGTDGTEPSSGGTGGGSPSTGSSSSDGAGGGRVIVKYASRSAGRRVAARLAEGAFKTVAQSEYGIFQVVEVPVGQTLGETVEQLSALPEVAYAEPDSVVSTAWVPNDPMYQQQWNFRMIGAATAWDLMAQAMGAAKRGGDPAVIVAVVDTGVAYEDFGIYGRAPDLAGTTFVPGHDFVNNDEHPNDDHGHGTHVTGTIAQTTDNAYGLAGLAFKTTIMPVKVLGSDGQGYTSQVADGIYWAVDHGASVVNLSLSGTTPSQTLRDAMTYASTKNVVLAVAAGNEGGAVGYPAKYNDVCISVGAVGSDGTRAYYSNYGSELDLVAPGGDSLVGVSQQSFPAGRPTSFEWQVRMGTSMATAHVTAAAALLKAAGITSPAEIERILRQSAKDAGAAGRDDLYGWGLLQLDQALYLATGISPPPPPPVLTPIDLILDDGDAGTSSTGSWSPSSASGGYNGDSLYAWAGTGSSYRWTPTITTAGVYSVYVRYTAGTYRSSAVPIRVTYATGSWVGSLDQTQNGGAWQLLGSWAFQPGLPGYLEISGWSSGQASADAVRLTTMALVSDNKAPTATDDVVSTPEDVAANWNLLANDTDPDGDLLSITTLTQPAHGIISVNADGTVHYVPTANYNGPDSFTYKISDGRGGTDEGLVSVTVTPVNDAPTAVADTAHVVSGASVEIDVLANDSDVDGDTLHVVSVTQGAYGTVSLTATGKVLYQSVIGSVTSDTFTYTVSDGNGGTATGTVSVTIEVPVVTGTAVIVDDGDAGTSFSGSWLPSSALGGLNGDSLYIWGATGVWYRWTPTLPMSGLYDVYLRWTSSTYRSTATAVKVNQAAGQWQTTVNQQESSGVWVLLGRWTFGAGTGGWVEVSGTSGQLSADAVKFVYAGGGVPVPNRSPVAVADAAATTSDVAVDVDVLANDTDPDGDALTVTGVTQGARGATAITTGGKVRYTPVAGTSGVDTFTYTVSDGKGGTAQALVTVTVTLAGGSPPPPGGTPTEAILDNGDAGTTSAGSWWPSSATGGYKGNSLYSWSAVGDWYRWTPKLTGTGSYEVYLRWTSTDYRSSAAPVRVVYSGGEWKGTVDQRSQSGVWVYLGRWTFVTGSTGFVELSAATTGQISADAVWFLPVP